MNFKSILFHEFDSGRRVQAFHADQSLVEKVFPPKVKETHFKVINNKYPVSEFLKRRFTFGPVFF